jgi:hypothetical protein
MALYVDRSTSTIVSLQSMIEKAMRDEHVIDHKCDDCGQLDAVLSHAFVHLPRYSEYAFSTDCALYSSRLILVIKRYHFDSIIGTSKIDTAISISSTLSLWLSTGIERFVDSYSAVVNSILQQSNWRWRQCFDHYCASSLTMYNNTHFYYSNL